MMLRQAGETLLRWLSASTYVCRGMHAHEAALHSAQAKKARPGDVLSDSRFAAMFENRDFEVDLDADEYKQLHPNAGGHL